MPVVAMPSPRGTNHERLFLPPASPVRLAYDAQPRGFTKFTRAARDQGVSFGQPDPERDNPYSSTGYGPGDQGDDPEDPGATARKVAEFLVSHLSAEDLSEMQEMMEQLTNDPDAEMNAADRKRWRAIGTTRAVAGDQPPRSRGQPRIASDSAAAVSMARRFPGINRLGRCY